MRRAKVAGKGQGGWRDLSHSLMSGEIWKALIRWARAEPGDKIILSWNVGRHGCTILLRGVGDLGMEGKCIAVGIVLSECYQILH